MGTMLKIPHNLLNTHKKSVGIEGLMSQNVSVSLLEPIVTVTYSVVLTFESVDKILWCDHLNKTLYLASTLNWE